MAQAITIFSKDKTELNQLHKLFHAKGYEVNSFSEATPEILNKVHEINPDILMLDLDLGEVDGIELCFQLKKEKTLDAFIILFSDKREEYIQIEAFKAGADDYIIKPIGSRLLVKRIEALLKRRSAREAANKPKVVTLNNLRIDRDRFQVYVGDKITTLPLKEFEILYLLISHPNRVFSRNEIYEKIWKKKVATNSRIIDVHIRKIRKKIGDSYIRTNRGNGYKFNAIEV